MNGARLLFFSLVSFNKNKNKTQQTKQQTKQKMSQSEQMKQACRDGKHEVVKKILSSHPESINFSDETQWTPLHYACRYGHKDVVSVLLAHGANMEAQDWYQRTPLHYTCRYGHKDVVSVLLAHGANVDAQDEFQRTPLHYACWYDHKDVVSVLLAHGANVEAQNLDGLKPKDFKIVQDYFKSIELKYGHFRDAKKFSQEIDKTPNKILDRHNQIQQFLLKANPTVRKLTNQSLLDSLIKNGPAPSFPQALNSLFVSLPFYSSSSQKNCEIETIICVCELVLAKKMETLKDNQILNLLTKDEALTILSYTFEQPYHIPSTFHQWLLSFTKKSIEENQEEIRRGGEKREEKREEKKGEKRGEERGGKDYYRLLVEGLGKLPRKVVKVEGMEEEVGVALVGDLSFDCDCKEGEGVVFPLLASFYEKTRTWKLIKTDQGYIPSPPPSPSPSPAPIPTPSPSPSPTPSPSPSPSLSPSPLPTSWQKASRASPRPSLSSSSSSPSSSSSSAPSEYSF